MVHAKGKEKEDRRVVPTLADTRVDILGILCQKLTAQREESDQSWDAKLFDMVANRNGGQRDVRMSAIAYQSSFGLTCCSRGIRTQDFAELLAIKCVLVSVMVE